MKQQGLIQVYTGDGKGKTTAAVGLACRARSHNLKVCYVYFHKEPEKFGRSEHDILKKIGVRVVGFAGRHPAFFKTAANETVRKECLKGMAFIERIYAGKKYDLLILDEINIAVRDGFLKEKEVLKMLNRKPKNIELVLTGRGATAKMIEKADLVSEVRKIKHPYDTLTQGRKGIEF